jgi:hypothetical protein
MDDDDNTLLYILLGAVLLYFFMKQSAPAIAAPQALPLLPSSLPPGSQATPQEEAQAAATTLSANLALATAPNADMGGADFGVITPGENW